MVAIQRDNAHGREIGTRAIEYLVGLDQHFAICLSTNRARCGKGAASIHIPARFDDGAAPPEASRHLLPAGPVVRPSQWHD